MRYNCAMNTRYSLTALFGLSVALTLSRPSAALVITPTFDASIAGHASAAAIMGTINSALLFYQTTFNDPITVNITFGESTTTPVAITFGTSTTITYAAFRTALLADSTSANDTIALASLPNVAANPANGALNITLKKPNLRALGLPAATASDGEILLNLGKLNFDRVTIDKTKIDLQAVVQHEVNEVLGFGSAININFDPFPQDLFRYRANGARTFTKDGNDANYSIDGGVTALAAFNMDPTGDYGDWFTGDAPQVQDAFFTKGATPNMGVEIIGLDTIGYSLAPAPEQGTLALLALGGVGAFVVRRRNRSVGKSDTI